MQSMNLSLRDDIKEYARHYAKSHGTNVSAVVEKIFSYLRDFEEGETKVKNRLDLLRERLPEIELVDDSDDPKYRYLKEKYID